MTGTTRKNRAVIALGAIAGFIVLSITIILAVQFATGRTPRAYQTISGDEYLVIAGDRISVSAASAIYAPQMHQDPTEPTPPLIEVKYELTQLDDEYIFNYYFVWEDEVHPSAYIHAAYWLYRAARYGYPVRDIEYIQVNVSTADGSVTKVRFETSPGDDYFVTNSVHLVADYYPLDANTLAPTVTSLDGIQVTSRTWPTLHLVDSHPQVGIATWNHLSRAVGDDSERYALRLDAPLTYLSSEEYIQDKYARKSHGDLGTPESAQEKLAAAIVTNAYFLVSGIALVALFLRLRRRR